jgi:hypothetical protein
MTYNDLISNGIEFVVFERLILGEFDKLEVIRIENVTEDNLIGYVYSRDIGNKMSYFSKVKTVSNKILMKGQKVI